MRLSDRGSALMLMPAAVLVLVILGAIAVDSAVLFLAQRELSNAAAGVANDIAGAGVSDGSFYDRGTVELDQGIASERTAAAFAAGRRPDAFDAWGGAATVDATSVTVEAWAEVRYVFAGALPGMPSSTTVRVTSVATARERDLRLKGHDVTGEAST